MFFRTNTNLDGFTAQISEQGIDSWTAPNIDGEERNDLNCSLSFHEIENFQKHPPHFLSPLFSFSAWLKKHLCVNCWMKWVQWRGKGKIEERGRWGKDFFEECDSPLQWREKGSFPSTAVALTHTFLSKGANASATNELGEVCLSLCVCVSFRCLSHSVEFAVYPQWLGRRGRGAREHSTPSGTGPSRQRSRCHNRSLGVCDLNLSLSFLSSHALFPPLPLPQAHPTRCFRVEGTRVCTMPRSMADNASCSCSSHEGLQ